MLLGHIEYVIKNFQFSLYFLHNQLCHFPSFEDIWVDEVHDLMFDYGPKQHAKLIDGPVLNLKI
jgi:hypothetical protein